MMEKRYLGDGIYVEENEFGIRITTENGIVITNSIYFEPEVLVKFLKYVNDRDQQYIVKI
jgi:hypothetical protein